MPGDERTLQPPGLAPDEVSPALERGELVILGALSNASNDTLLVRALDPGTGGEELAVYKPRGGEAPLWDFPDGTLCNRETAAYRVARSLGWPVVPPTVLRGGPAGQGAVQRYVEHDPRQHYFTLQAGHERAFRDVALFDLAVNNADRKGGHCLLGHDGRIHLIDHGLCFHEEPKLRTVIWEFVGEPIDAGRLGDLARLRVRLEAEGGDLSDLLSPRELEAFARRIDRLCAVARFPAPGAGRPFPWPPV